VSWLFKLDTYSSRHQHICTGYTLRKISAVISGWTQIKNQRLREKKKKTVEYMRNCLMSLIINTLSPYSEIPSLYFCNPHHKNKNKKGHFLFIFVFSFFA